MEKIAPYSALRSAGRSGGVTLHVNVPTCHAQLEHVTQKSSPSRYVNQTTPKAFEPGTFRVPCVQKRSEGTYTTKSNTLSSLLIEA